MNEIESHNGIKGTASPVYFQRKSLPGHKEKNRTRLETNSPLKYRCERAGVPSMAAVGLHPKTAQLRCRLLVSCGNVSHPFRLKGILHPNYVFNPFSIFQVKQTCHLLNYLRNRFHPSAPKGRMLFQWLPLIFSLSCDFLLPEARDPLSNLPRALTGSHSPVLFVHLNHMTLLGWRCLTLYEWISGSSVPRWFWDHSSLKVDLFISFLCVLMFFLMHTCVPCACLV